MQTTVRNYFDDETLERVATKFYIDDEEVCFEDYRDFIEELYEDEVDQEDDCVCGQEDNCEKCDCDECLGCDNTKCCEENQDCEDNELEELECDCPICEGENEAQDLSCYCPECMDDYIKESIEECLEHVFNGCPECAVDGIIKLAHKCLELGKQSVKQEVSEFLED